MNLEDTLAAMLYELKCIRVALENPRVTVNPGPVIDPNQLALSLAPAPSTAVAAPLPIAHEAPQDTSPPPTSVFGQAALPPGAVEPTAAPITTSPAPAGSLDKNGLPWDGRIHASSKAKVADGSWRTKRGVDPALVTQVETELRTALSAAPLPPAFGAWPIAGAPITFPELMGKLPALITAGTTDSAAITAACLAVGVDGIPSLMVRPDLVPAVAAALGIV